MNNHCKLNHPRRSESSYASIAYACDGIDGAVGMLTTELDAIYVESVSALLGCGITNSFTSSKMLSESSSMKMTFERTTFVEGSYEYSRILAFLSDSFQPPAGAGILMGRGFFALASASRLASSQGTSVYLVIGVVTSGLPLGPKIPTAESACLRLHTHLFRRLADIMSL